MRFFGETHRLKFVTDAIYGDHLRGLGHPESPDRVEVVASRLHASGTLRDALPARDATEAELERVHAPSYVELVKREIGSLRGPRYLSTGDVVVDNASLDVARRAAGGSIAAMEATVQSGKPAFALVRPPGHHAEPGRGMGFCLFNNAAVAARAFKNVTPSGVEGRVLVVDFDYHHGNGTQAVAGDGLSYVSTHAYPAYPGTGRESYVIPSVSSRAKSRDAVVNVPLPAGGISTEAFVALWECLLPMVAAALRPDLLVVSAGFDYVAGDPVGDLGVGIEAASGLAATINAVAAEHCGGRAVYLLEGGYDIDALTGSIERIAGAADAGTTAKSGAEAAAAPPGVQELLRRISLILQGSMLGGTN